MKNLIVEKDGIAVITDRQFRELHQAVIKKGAVLVTVPDDTTAAERVRIAREKLKEA